MNILVTLGFIVLFAFVYTAVNLIQEKNVVEQM